MFFLPLHHVWRELTMLECQCTFFWLLSFLCMLTQWYPYPFVRRLVFAFGLLAHSMRYSGFNSIQIFDYWVGSVMLFLKCGVATWPTCAWHHMTNHINLGWAMFSIAPHHSCSREICPPYYEISLWQSWHSYFVPASPLAIITFNRSKCPAQFPGMEYWVWRFGCSHLPCSKTDQCRATLWLHHWLLRQPNSASSTKRPLLLLFWPF